MSDQQHQQHYDDLAMVNELLNKHADELTDVETEAFAGMRFSLQVQFEEEHAILTPKQRAWVTAVRERIVPQYANLVSRGLVPKGTSTAESKALDAMLAAPKLVRPPLRRKDDE